jgi:hypothetical protein
MCSLASVTRKPCSLSKNARLSVTASTNDPSGMAGRTCRGHVESSCVHLVHARDTGSVCALHPVAQLSLDLKEGDALDDRSV